MPDAAAAAAAEGGADDLQDNEYGVLDDDGMVIVDSPTRRLIEPAADDDAAAGDGAAEGARAAELMALVAEAANTVDEEVRKTNYAKAIELITERAYMVPMHTVVMGYAYDSDLNFTPNVDEIPRFFLASW